MEVNFSKYEGAGNDFVLVDVRQNRGFCLDKEQIARICHRRFGVGADGLMLLGDEQSQRKVSNDRPYDFSMRYFNSDGSESTMCGNGGRCITRFADDLGIGGKEKIFLAIDGAHNAAINDDQTITLSMIDVKKIDRVDEGWLLNTGSPHLVVCSKNYDENEARELRHKYNCNVNYVNVLGTKKLSITTFERGVEAKTWACGTGATAAAIVASAYLLQVSDNQKNERQTIRLVAMGGELEVSFLVDGNRYFEVTLRGGARKVFDGLLHI